MTGLEAKEIQQVFGVLAPMLQQAIEIGVLKALRRDHKDEQHIEVGSGQIADLKIDVQELVKSESLDEQMLALVGEFDAQKWAKQFKRLNPSSDEGTMVGWFANTIMAGYDHAKKEDRKKLNSMQDCLNIQGSQGNWDADHYMHGMFNGMEHMMAIMEDREPRFRSWPKDNSIQQQTPHEQEQDRLRSLVSRVSSQDVWAQVYSEVFCGAQRSASPGYASSVAIKAANDAVQQLEKWLDK